MLNKAPKQLIVDLLNATNGTTFTAAELEIGDVRVLAPENGDKNTAAVVTAADGSPFKGPATIYYDRVDLAELAAARTFIEIEDVGYDSAHDMLAEINAALGTALTAADIEDQAITGADYPKFVIIRAVEGNLAFHGQCSVDIVNNVV